MCLLFQVLQQISSPRPRTALGSLPVGIRSKPCIGKRVRAVLQSDDDFESDFESVVDEEATDKESRLTKSKISAQMSSSSRLPAVRFFFFGAFACEYGTGLNERSSFLSRFHSQLPARSMPRPPKTVSVPSRASQRSPVSLDDASALQSPPELDIADVQEPEAASPRQSQVSSQFHVGLAFNAKNKPCPRRGLSLSPSLQV